MELSVLLDHIRSAYNVGSIFRTCDSAGVNKLLLTGWCPTPPHPKLDKTALGSIHNVNWEHHCQPDLAVKNLKTTGIEIVCFETNPNAVSLFEYQFKENSCLIFGNEENGISPEVLALSDGIVKIPQYGIKESLNVASAAAIAIYEFRRQRPKISSHD